MKLKLSIICLIFLLSGAAIKASVTTSSTQTTTSHVFEKDSGDDRYKTIPTKNEIENLSAKSLGKRMVEFIRRILGDEVRPIDESLVRDEE